MSTHGTTIPGQSSHPDSDRAGLAPPSDEAPPPPAPSTPAAPPAPAALLTNGPVRVVPSPAPAAAVPTDLPLPTPGDPGLLFFGAHRRSGTTWLTSMLNTHPEVHIRNEGWLLNEQGRSFEEWFDRKRFDLWANSREAKGTWLKDMSADEAALLMQRQMLRSLLFEATRRDDWKQWSRIRWVGDKTTTFYTSKLDILHRLFPDARFLSMVRDGRDTVVSNLFLTFRQKGFNLLPPECSEHALKAYEYHGLRRGRPVPLFTPALMRFLVTEWVDAVYGARRAAAAYGPAFLEVRYEDLVESPERELERVLRWLGVAAHPDMVYGLVRENSFERNSGGRKRGEEDPLAEWRKGVVGDWRNHFTEDDKHLFKAMAGSLLVDLGYERTLDW